MGLHVLSHVKGSLEGFPKLGYPFCLLSHGRGRYLIKRSSYILGIRIRSTHILGNGCGTAGRFMGT